MSGERVDVLAVMADHAENAPTPRMRKEMRESLVVVADLIEADKEYDAAQRDWEEATNNDPLELSDETWRRIADRYEEATMRRIHALSRIQPDGQGAL